MDNLVVTEVRPCKEQGQRPDHYDGHSCVSGGAEIPGLQWVADGQVPGGEGKERPGITWVGYLIALQPRGAAI